jgi:hypothetical protein
MLVMQEIVVGSIISSAEVIVLELRTISLQGCEETTLQ